MDLLRREFFVSNDRWVAVPLAAADAPALQDFLDANPLYSQIVNARPFRPGEALEEITDVPPFAHRQAHAVALGATPYTGADRVLDLPAIVGIGGSLIYFTDQYGDGSSTSSPGSNIEAKD